MRATGSPAEIVDCQIVGSEPRRDSPGQGAVRRDERGGLARRLDRFAQDQSDGLSLVMSRRRLDQLDAGKRALQAPEARLRVTAMLLQESLPAIRLAGWPQHFADEAKPRARGGLWLAAWNRRHLVAGHPELGKKLGHAGLRVLWVFRQARPAFLVHGEIETGEHHGAVRQRSDHLEEPRRRQHGASRTCGDHRTRWRMALEARGFERHQFVPPRHRRHQTLLFKMARPMLRDDVEELDGPLPMRGVLDRHEVAQR